MCDGSCPTCKMSRCTRGKAASCSVVRIRPEQGNGETSASRRRLHSLSQPRRSPPPNVPSGPGQMTAAAAHPSRRCAAPRSPWWRASGRLRLRVKQSRRVAVGTGRRQLAVAATAPIEFLHWTRLFAHQASSSTPAAGTIASGCSLALQPASVDHPHLCFTQIHSIAVSLDPVEASVLRLSVARALELCFEPFAAKRIGVWVGDGRCAHATADGPRARPSAMHAGADSRHSCRHQPKRPASHSSHFLTRSQVRVCRRTSSCMFTWHGKYGKLRPRRRPRPARGRAAQVSPAAAPAHPPPQPRRRPTAA